MDKVQQRHIGRIHRSEKNGKPNSKISIRTMPDGRKCEWHPTKGFRRWIDPPPARDPSN